LASALRQAKAAKEPDSILSIVGLYGDLSAEVECIKLLKDG